ncbi:MAG: cytochrome c oxidase assembly protein [Alphaproteobacteria bacterium]
MSGANQTLPRRRNIVTAVILTSVVAGMVGLSYAAVPLYRAFCQLTGIGGTTQRAARAPDTVVADRPVRVRFDANVNAALPWHFEPVERVVTVKPGEQTLVFYRATNRSDRPTTGTATFNVTPPTAGLFFTKIECFCFTEQTLGPNQTVEMPVLFFVDPAIVSDRRGRDVTTITLSYTFFPSPPAVAPRSAARPAKPAG